MLISCSHPYKIFVYSRSDRYSPYIKISDFVEFNNFNLNCISYVYVFNIIKAPNLHDVTLKPYRKKTIILSRRIYKKQNKCYK